MEGRILIACGDLAQRRWTASTIVCFSLNLEMAGLEYGSLTKTEALHAGIWISF